MNKSMFIPVQIIFFLLIIVISTQLGICRQFEKNVLLETTYYGKPFEYTISPDSRYLILWSFPEKDESVLITLINLETGAKINIRYLNPLIKNYLYDLFWENNTNLIVRADEPLNYYSLEIKEPEAIFKKLEHFTVRNFNLGGFDPNYFNMLNSWDDERLGSAIPEFRKEGKEMSEKITLFYKGNKIASYGATHRLGTKRWSLLKMCPTFRALSISPDKHYIFYVIDWSIKNPLFNSPESYLYCLDTLTNKVVEIDENFGPYDPLIMAWSPDSKKFIYRQRGEGDDIYRIIELTLEK